MFTKIADFSNRFLLKCCVWSDAKVCNSCSTRKIISNAYFLAKFRFDTAENEAAKKIAKSAIFAIFADRRLVAGRRRRGVRRLGLGRLRGGRRRLGLGRGLRLLLCRLRRSLQNRLMTCTKKYRLFYNVVS